MVTRTGCIAAAIDCVKDRETEKRELYLIHFLQQGQMVKLEEEVIKRSLSWDEICKWSTSRRSFLLHATYVALPNKPNEMEGCE